jgi:hypothetical protein
MNVCKNCGETIEMGQTILFQGKDKIHSRCKRERIECFACGCRIYPNQSLYPRPKDPMHLMCGNEAERAWPDVPGAVSFYDCVLTPLTKWPSSILSDEWKDFWMECRKHDRAEIDKSRSRT